MLTPWSLETSEIFTGTRSTGSYAPIDHYDRGFGHRSALQVQSTIFGDQASTTQRSKRRHTAGRTCGSITGPRTCLSGTHQILETPSAGLAVGDHRPGTRRLYNNARSDYPHGSKEHANKIVGKVFGQLACFSHRYRRFSLGGHDTGPRDGEAISAIQVTAFWLGECWEVRLLHFMFICFVINRAHRGA